MMKTGKQFKGVGTTDLYTPTSTPRFITYKPPGTVQTTPTTSDDLGLGVSLLRVPDVVGELKIGDDRTVVVLAGYFPDIHNYIKRLPTICQQHIFISFAHTFSRKSGVGQHNIEGLRGFMELNVPITVEPGVTAGIACGGLWVWSKERAMEAGQE